MGFIENDLLSVLIILAAMVLFALEKIPIALTAIITSLAMGVLGVMPLTSVYVGFSSTLFVMVFGMLIIGDCLFATGLVKGIGQWLSRSRLMQNELLLLLVLMCFAGVTSAFLSNTAVMATMIPLVTALALTSGGRIKRRYLLMGLGMATSIGGTATLVGSTAQLMSQSILQSTDGVREMTFFELGYVVVPLFVLLLLYFVVFGYRWQKKVFTFPEEAEPVLDGLPEPILDADEGFKWTPKMMVAAGVMVFCIVGFVTGLWNIAIVALVGASVCLVAGCKPFKKTMADLDWNTLILLAAAQGFAVGLDVSGGGKLLASWALMLGGAEAPSPLLLLALGTFIAVFLTNIMSNTAVAAMLVPIYINIAFQLGYDPLIFVLAITIGASASIATPIASSPMSMILVGGYRFNDYLKVGLPITIILMLATIFLSPLMYGGFKLL
ncbi:MAG: SLC13/DASS family transporter [Neisseriaceae bacterium]|nr:SLC13/DASS family transporter [Neisseriaceae bacterium]MBP6862521.1 SLC13/DASS family transporter [Neisseriaceae bacterium]